MQVAPKSIRRVCVVCVCVSVALLELSAEQR